MSLMSRIGYDWAVRCFGLDHNNNLALRSQRTLEESAELSQALGLSRRHAHKTIDAVYDRPVGEPEQEIGGILHTVGILCESMHRDPDVLHERELRRVLTKSPEHFAKRNQEKLDLGLDAQAQSSGDPSLETQLKNVSAHLQLFLDDYIERGQPPLLKLGSHDAPGDTFTHCYDESWCKSIKGSARCSDCPIGNDQPTAVERRALDAQWRMSHMVGGFTGRVGDSRPVNLVPDTELKAPVKAFGETFSGETAVMESIHESDQKMRERGEPVETDKIIP